MADGVKPFSEVVRTHGDQTWGDTAAAADAWRVWADALDKLVRTMPGYCRPRVYDESGDLDLVETAPIDRAALRFDLYHLLSTVDGYAASLARTASFVAVQSEELAAALAIDEAAESGVDGESRG